MVKLTLEVMELIVVMFTLFLVFFRVYSGY